MRKNKLVDLKYEAIIHETGLAYLIRFDDEKQEWFPKEAVEVDEDDNVVTMRESLAVEKGVECHVK